MSDSFILKKQLGLLNSNQDESIESSQIQSPHLPVQLANNSIGEFYSKSKAPIDYFVRGLAFKFLLDVENFNPLNESNCSINFKLSKLRPDSQVKVLIKTIAFDCCSSAITLLPNVLFYSIYCSNETNQVAAKMNKPESESKL